MKRQNADRRVTRQLPVWLISDVGQSDFFMNYRSAFVALLSIGAFLLSGCVSSDVISTGPDTYMVSASGAGFATAGVREVVYKKANEFCAAKGLVMVPVSLKVRPGELGRNPPSADLIFRALKPGDPAIGRPDLTGDDERLATTQRINVSVKGDLKKEPQADTYTELLKLDDLKKRGILTESEFEEQKKKLLQPK